MCAEIPEVRARTEVLILRHVKEVWKSTNTARLAAMAVRGTRLVTYGAPGTPFDEGLVSAPGTWLLFPEAGGAEPAEPAPSRLVVLDGSWGQARRMLQRVPALRRLPRLRLDSPAPERTRMRRPPSRDGMSTLEAIGHALERVEGADVGRPLLALYDLAVERVLATRGRLGS